MIICLEGIDGAGKSSICRALTDVFPGQYTYRPKKSLENVPPEAAERLASIYRLLWGDLSDPPREDDLYWLCANYLWYYLQRRWSEDLATQSSRVLLIDGWMSKALGRLALDGAARDMAELLFESASTGITFIFLDCDPTVCATRKVPLSDYEQGKHSGLDSQLYRRRTYNVLKQLATSRGWRQVKVSDDLSIRDVANAVHRAITDVRK